MWASSAPAPLDCLRLYSYCMRRWHGDVLPVLVFPSDNNANTKKGEKNVVLTRQNTNNNNHHHHHYHHHHQHHHHHHHHQALWDTKELIVIHFCGSLRFAGRGQLDSCPTVQPSLFLPTVRKLGCPATYPASTGGHCAKVSHD